MHSHLKYLPLNANSAKTICFIIFVVLFFVVVLPPYSGEASKVSSQATLPTSDHTTPLKPSDAFGRLPLSFELNQGQTDSQVRFLARGQGYALLLTSNGAEFSFNEPSTALRMYLQGAATSPRIRGVDELPGKVNYFFGRESDKWRTNIPTYERVSYEEIYPGVDLIYYGNQRQLEYDFVIAPDASFKQIRLAFEGAGKLRLNRHGDLIIKSGPHKITLLRPKAYQEIGKKRREVSIRYLLNTRGQVTFQIGDYDKRQQLIIDPVLVYSSFLGGSDQDRATGIAVDSSGNAYITGQTSSLNFPTGSPLQAAHAGGVQDAFVSKLNASGSALVYSTYLGGSGTEVATSIAVDNAGNAYITGQTTSSNFPLSNALHPTLSGSNDGFIAELNAFGSALVYSTFLGGRGSDEGLSIAVDSLSNAYVTGFTSSRDFPTTNPLQTSRSGNAIFKSVNSAGSWAASDSGLIAATVSDLKVDPSNSSIAYAAK